MLTLQTQVLLSCFQVHLTSANPNNKVQVCSVQEAVRAGADGVAVHINVGAADEDKMLTKLGRVADECEIYGMPL